jgi:hypothetical protein
MPHYQTRHMEALDEFPHGDQLVRKGDRFPATEIDAEYLVRRRKAKDVTDESHAAAVAAPAVKQAPPAAAAPAPTPPPPPAPPPAAEPPAAAAPAPAPEPQATERAASADTAFVSLRDARPAAAAPPAGMRRGTRSPTAIEKPDTSADS